METKTFISGYTDKSMKQNDAGVEKEMPKFGDKVTSSGTVIAYHHLDDGSEGWYPNGIALLHRPHGIGEYCTSRLAITEHGFVTEVGVYPRTFEQAVRNFIERCENGA